MAKDLIAHADARRFMPLLAFLAATSALISLPARAQSLPTDGQVVAGSASIATSGGGMTVTQASDRAVIDWSGFSVGQNNNVVFAQPDASAAILNRVRGDAPSSIAGSITSNGAVYLVNPNGIFITETGTVNAGGGFVASSLDITNEDFLAKKHDFTGHGASALVRNAGRITAGQGAYVALLGGAVSNSGTINVPLGRLGLGSGEQVALDINGGNFMQVAVPSALVTGGNTLVDNSGTIVVLGGSVQMKAAALRDAVRNLVNMSGTISADSATGQAGSIELSAGGAGNVAVSGAISASATGAGGSGGKVTIEGRDIALAGSAAISATGTNGGGTVLVGGGYRGEGDLAQAQTVSMASGATIDVSATGAGAGGTAILWSDITDGASVTDFKGTIRARGAGVGSGGLVETSGYHAEVAGGLVNAGSDLGAGGLWLVDPSDSTITQGVANSYAATLNNGTSVLNDVNGAITWNSGVTLNKTAGGDATLTLRSTNGGGINLNGATINSTAGALNLVLWTRYNNSGAPGKISITGSSINTNGGHVWMGGSNQAGSLWNGLTVGDGVAATWSIADQAIFIKNSSINSGAGSMWLGGLAHYSGGAAGSGYAGIKLDSGTSLTTTSGNISLNGAINGTYDNGAGVWLGGEDAGNTTLSTTSGAITLSGEATDQASSRSGYRHGVVLYGRASNMTSLSTISGDITLNGTGNSTSASYTSDSSGIQFQTDTAAARVAVTSRTGAISLTGISTLEPTSVYINGIRFAPANATNAIRIGYDGTNAYSGTITINANSILQREANYSNTGPISIQSTGGLVIQPVGNSFTYLRADTGTLNFGSAWNFGTTLSSFTIGKASNTFDLTFDNPGFKVNGPVSLYGGNINLTRGMESVLYGADMLVKATGRITSTDGLGFYTNNGDIIFWSNSAGSLTAGGIWIGASNVFNSAYRLTTQLTGGGDIILGGGSNAGDRPTGAASSSTGFGIGIGTGSTGTPGTTTSLFYSGGGAISLNGRTTATVSSQNGISLNRGFTMNAGNGDISLTGYSNTDGQGIELGGWGQDSAPYSIKGGSITMSGTGGVYYGVGSLHVGGTIEATGSSGIVINGSTTGSGANYYGVYFANGSVNLISNSGPISVTGTTNGTTGLSYLGKILSASGDISLNSGTKTLIFQGTIGRDSSLVTASTSNVTLTANAVTFTSTAINTSGTVTVQPFGTSFSSALTWPISNLTLSSDVSGLTLGKPGNTSGITVSTATSIAGPISLYGGNIALNANLTSTLAGADILVKATGSITSTDGRTFRTKNGDLVFWSNAAGGTGGMSFGNGTTFNTADGSTSQMTGGGEIIFGGGSNAGLVPTGAATSSTAAGIAFGSPDTGPTTTSFYSGGGNITVNAASTYTGGNAFGIAFNRIISMNAGNGSITLTGNATNGHGMEIGAYNGTGTISQILAGGDITISGTTTSSGADGVSMGQSGTRIQSTGAGNIGITGRSGTGSTGRGLSFGGATNALITNSGSISFTSIGGSTARFSGGGKILSSSGAISINSGTGTMDLQATIGRDGSTVTTSSSNVTLTGDTVAFGGASAINTSGTVTVQPFSTSFASALTWPLSNLTLSSDVSGLTLGKSGNLADITIGSAANVNGPITVHAGNIIVNAALSAAGNAISLNAAGTGGISGSATGTIGNFSTLTLNATNASASGTLAGAISGTGSLSKTGAGTTTLSGANGYSGATLLSAGTLRAGLPGAFGNASAVTVASGATLDLAGFTSTIGALSGAGTVTNSSATAATLVTGSLNASTTFSGTIQNGAGQVALTKEGSGTFTLSGTNSYGGTTRINAGTLTLSGALNLGAGTATTIVASGATLGGTGVLTADTLNHSGAGTLTLTGANLVNAIATSGNIGDFTLYNAKSVALGSMASTGRIVVSAVGSSSDLSLQPSAAIIANSSGDAVILSAGRNFANGGAVLTPNGRWLIYAATPGGSSFHNLNSGNTAIWNSVYSGGTVSQSGNRYVFATQPTLTVSPTSFSKTYGDDAGSAVSAAYTISGYQAGVAGAFLGDDAASALSGMISFASAGSAVTANVGGYGISIVNNTLVAANGYALAIGPAGTLTVNQRTVTLSAAKVYDGSTSLTGAVTIGNLANGEMLTYSGATASSAHVADNATNRISAITLGNGTGLASNYALPILDSTNAGVAITPASLTALAGITGPLSKVYDGTTGTVASVAGSVLGAIAGDNIAFDASGITLGYDSAHVATASSISASGTGGFTITGSVSGSQASDYSFTAPTIASIGATITPANLTAILGNAPASKVYDGTTDAPGSFVPGWVVSGAISGDNVTLTSGSAAFDSKDVASASRLTVSGFAIAGVSGSAASLVSDYRLDTLSADIGASITPALLTISGLAANNKTYDGTTAATMIDWGALSGLVGVETLTLLHGNASFASAGAGTGKLVTATGYALGNGAHGGLASNYALVSNVATTSATIDKAVLTVIANNDAKFITRSDNPGYAGVSYTGFVNGEGSAVLSGAASITRTNTSEQSAGAYAGVLQADTSGLSAANYSFVTRNGDFTIVPSSQLLVRVANGSSVYGATADYAINSAQYFDGVNVIDLGAAVRNSDGSYTLSDGAGGSATFGIGLADVVHSGAGLTAVGSYQLIATNVTTRNAANFSNMLNLVGALSITPKEVVADTASGVSKVYDGTTAMEGATVNLAGLLAGDHVSVSGEGAFASANAGTGLAYTVSNIQLGGADAGNYYTSSGSFSGSDGTITPRQIIVTANDATRSYGSADPAFTYSVGGAGLVAGEALTGGLSTSANGLSSIGRYGIDQGSLAASSNYEMGYVGGTLTITQRDVAQWVGGATGNWFDPANWADGAVPTLSNVGNVLIPAGVVVTFDTQGALAGVPTGPVNLGGLGQGGSLLMNDGALNVGSGGINLAGLTQTGGALESVGSISLGSFTQTGGTTSTQGSFTTTTGFTQTGGGALNIGGNAAIGATSGAVTLGNLSVAGDLAVESKDGPIRQSEGTHIAVDGTGSYTAKKDGQPADIALDNAGNDLGSKVSANGANVSLAQEGALTLGTTVASGNLDIKAGGKLDFGQTDVGGNLHATSAQGGITQSGPLTVAGSTSLGAGTGDIALGNGANSFGGAVSMHGNEMTLSASTPIILGNIDATGALTVNSGSGQITQAPGTSRNVAGGVKISGPAAGTQSITPFIVPEHLVASDPATPTARTEAGATGKKAVGSCDPAIAADIYRNNGALSASAGGCGAQ